MTEAESKLAEFKRLSKDRTAHPDAVQAAWEAFIEASQKEITLKASSEEA